MSAGVRQLSDILLDDGLVSEAELLVAYDEHVNVGRPLGRILVERGFISEAQLVAALAQQVGLDFIDLSDAVLDGSAVGRVPAAICRRHTVLPVGFDDGRLVLAMADPGNVFALDDVRSMTGLDVRAVVATRDDVLTAIDRYCRSDAEMDDITSSMSVQEEEEDLTRVSQIVEEAPIVKYVNLLIT